MECCWDCEGSVLDFRGKMLMGFRKRPRGIFDGIPRELLRELLREF